MIENDVLATVALIGAAYLFSTGLILIISEMFPLDYPIVPERPIAEKLHRAFVGALPFAFVAFAALNLDNVVTFVDHIIFE